MTPKKVTILMSVYNGERYLRQAVESILNQTYSDFEFLIIDDASTDRSLKILHSYNDPRIRIVENTENLGLTKSLNKGLGLAKGEYIARMDADDISLPDRLAKEVEYLDSYPEVAMVGTGRENIDENGRFLEAAIPPQNVTVNHLLKGNQFQHSSVMFRKDIVLNEGGYCPQMVCCQDYLLWLKLARSHALHNIPEVLCQLRVQKNSVSNKKLHESILSHIFAIRIFKKIMKECDIHYDITSIDLSKNEKIYYLIRLAECYKINENFAAARKVYLKIFLLDFPNTFAIINYFRMFFGKWIILKTTQVFGIVKKRKNYE